MPKVTFVNEHRVVETEPGRLISDIAAELGIAVCRETFAGTGIGDYTCWVKGEPGATSPPTFMEKLLGARGWKRMANRTRVLGDVQVWTQAGPGNRLRSPRPVAPPPNPSQDPSAPRKPIDASGSAAFPYGDPRAVGHGKREPIAAGALEAKAAKEKKAKAAPAQAAAAAKPTEAPTKAPDAPTKAPEATAAKVPEGAATEAAAKAPEATTQAPKATAAKATEGTATEAVAKAPEATTQAPEATAKAPEATAAKAPEGTAAEAKAPEGTAAEAKAPEGAAAAHDS